MSHVEPEIGRFEAQEIKERVARLLRDMGSPKPPLRLEEVRAQQKLDLTYYRKADLNLLDEIAHRTRLAGNDIAASATRMRDVVEKYGIRGMILLAKGDKRIFIDDEVKQLKRRFVIAHEITHDLLDWHQSLLLGDNETTLSPTCHQIMEAEANFGARQLLFMGERFAREARDLAFGWSAIKSFQTAYGNTLTTTLWQMVCERDPTQPAFGLISKHPYYPDVCQRAGSDNVAYFPRSAAFQRFFPAISGAAAYAEVARHATRRKKGPVGAGESVLKDANGDMHVFEVDSFCNQYDLLTFGIYKRPHGVIYPVAGQRSA